jgi:FkbM family methyltransferase
MIFLEELKAQHPKLENIFEIGAHRGHDIPQILNMWPNATIYAFEADPVNYQICQKKFIGDKRVHVYDYAVIDTTKEVTFNRFYDIKTIPDDQTMVDDNFQNTGQGSILKCGTGMKQVFGINDPIEEFIVSGICLDDFCKNEGGLSIDALFMDVQGAEMHVFNGCKGLLDTIKATIFEWSSKYVMYDGETDFDFIKLFLEVRGLREIQREYQSDGYGIYPGLFGDSLFVR